MVAVTFIQPDASRATYDLPEGPSLLEAALAAHVPGLKGTCGGAINCSTCLVDVPCAWLARLPEQDPDEVELLHFVPEAGPRSRLTCQIPVSPALDGIELVVVPVRPLAEHEDFDI